jgi:uncharacterized repeat protein (TIGR03803 family)
MDFSFHASPYWRFSRRQSAAQTSGFATIYSFNGTDGYQPQSSMIFGRDGALYGTTNSGPGAGQGTIFKLTPSGSAWTETVLYDFYSYEKGAFLHPHRRIGCR